MLTFLLQYVLPLMGTVVLGAVGWLCTHFVAMPILQFREIRAKAHEAIFYTANAGASEDHDYIASGRNELRRLAARLNALVATASWPARAFYRCRGYDLAKAASGLLGLSNTIARTAEMPGERGTHRSQVQRALRLPID